MRTPSPRFSSQETLHCLKLAFYWPIFGLLFFAAERLFQPAHFHVIYCRLDDYIPFCEFFLIPYLFWFIFLLGIHIYTFLYDKTVFQKLMWFVILTYSFALLAFFLYPNCQTLRPAIFPRNNLFTRFMTHFYQFDTSTNVCPSLHVIGSLAVWSAARETQLFRCRGWRLFFHIATVLICISTVFLKQHSVLDLVAGTAVSALAHILVYRKEELRSLLRMRHRKKQIS